MMYHSDVLASKKIERNLERDFNMVRKLKEKDQIQILLRNEYLDEEIQSTAKKVKRSKSVLRATEVKFSEDSQEFSDSK